MNASFAEAPDKGVPPDYIAQSIVRTPRPRQKSRKRIELELLGMRIADCRTAMGLSQETLAKKTGLSKGTIKRIERGETSPSYETLYRFSRALRQIIQIKAY